MKFLIDENLPSKMAKSLSAIEQDVSHVTDVLEAGATDVEVLEYAGNNDLFLITKDLRIRYRPNEKEAIKKHKVGVFLLGGKNRQFFETYQQLIRNWPRILECAESTNRPFIKWVPPNGRKIASIPI